MSEANDLISGRHKPNALSVQSGLLSNNSPNNHMDLKSRNQSPLSNPNVIQSVISENSQEIRNDSDDLPNQAAKPKKVSDSVDKLFKNISGDRQDRKILMIGGKRVHGGSSSSSRERELVRLYKKQDGKIRLEKVQNDHDTDGEKENVHTNVMSKVNRTLQAENMFTPSNDRMKTNVLPNLKDTLELKLDEKATVNSPQNYVTPRTNILIDKTSKNKLSMINLGKGKFGSKNKRNDFLKPPKKSYTINSNRNSSSDSSFSSIGQIGVKPAFQEQFTPNNMIRGSFEIRSNHDLNNTAQAIMRKQSEQCNQVVSPNIYSTVDYRDSGVNEMLSKGKVAIDNMQLQARSPHRYRI